MSGWIFSDNITGTRVINRKTTWPELLSEHVRSKRPSSWCYAKTALLNGANGVVVGTVCMAGLATSSSLSLLVLAGLQAAVAATAPRLPFFRRMVNRKIAGEEDQAVSRERAAILSQMDSQHARMVEAMETMFEGVHDESVKRPSERALMNNTLAHERLLGCFARLAVAHKRVRDHLLYNPVVAPSTERRIPMLSFGGPPGLRAANVEPGRVADVHWQRCELQRKHMEVRWRNEERLALIEQQLGVIFDMARLIHEQSAADPTIDWIEDDLDEVFGEIERSGQAFEDWSQTEEASWLADEVPYQGKLLTLPQLRREAHS